MTQSRFDTVILQTKLFKTQLEWERWLAKNFNTSVGLWLRLAKKSSTLKSVTYLEALDSALCYGWVDGQKRSYDEATWLQKFTPRTKSSIWSKINKGKALRLIDKGLMKPSGYAAIAQAKENGRWKAAYGSQKTISVPRDFQNALNTNDRAKSFFAKLNSVNRYAILFRLQTAKKAETRRQRIDKFMAMLAEHKTIYPM